MSDGTKIALGIGAVAVVGYFVVSTINKPKVVPSGTALNNTTTAFVSGIIQGFAGIGKAFSSSPSTTGNAPLAGISTATPYVDPNSNIDPSTGGVYIAPDATYGPTLPS
jgi:hypothetical protein